MQFPLALQTIRFSSTQVELYVPDEQAVKEAYQKGRIPFPFWSQVWPASKALAQYLLDYPSHTVGKHVLEIGAGLGLPSLVAARNAASVLCTDLAPDAVSIIRQSAQFHRLRNFQASVLDWNDLPQNLNVDVLLLSDINYEPSALAGMEKLIHRFLRQEATVVLSTPQRLMAKEFISSLLTYSITQEQIAVSHAGQLTPISILVLHA